MLRRQSRDTNWMKNSFLSNQGPISLEMLDFTIHIGSTTFLYFSISNHCSYLIHWFLFIILILGVFGLPHCPGETSTLCEEVRKLLNEGAYLRSAIKIILFLLSIIIIIRDVPDTTLLFTGFNRIAIYRKYRIVP